ncbi:hypothetical protein [Solemya pervernicosa gill symbiont]|nr:hypothetical protein [Solemya pervernicosa gill symbiont]
MSGEIPHVDYWAAYPPGTSLTLAAFFYLFEPSLIIARFVNLGWTTLLLSSFYLTLRHFTHYWKSLLGTVLASLWVSSSLYPSYSAIPALAIIFFVLFIYFKAIKSETNSLLYLAGSVAGISVIFRHDFTAYLFISCLFALTLLHFTHSHTGQDRLIIRKTATFLTVFLITSLISLFLLLMISGWHNFYEQAIKFPATGMRDHRLLPVPGFLEFPHHLKKWLLAWTAPILCVFTSSYLYIFRNKTTLIIKTALLILLCMSFFLTFQAHSRLDMTHAVPSMLFSILLLATLSSSISEHELKVIKLIDVTLLTSLILITLFLCLDRIKTKNSYNCAVNLTENSCARAHPLQEEVVDYIWDNHSNSNYIFVGNTYHDKIFINDASLYFLLKKPIPVMWNEMHPGIVTTSEVQKEIIDQLNKKEVNIIVLSQMPTPQENNKSSMSSKIHILDRFIAKNFHVIAKNTRYSILKRTVD